MQFPNKRPRECAHCGGHEFVSFNLSIGRVHVCPYCERIVLPPSIDADDLSDEDLRTLAAFHPAAP